MKDTKYLPKSYWGYLFGTAALFLLWQIIPYNHMLSILFQIAVVGITVVFYINKPIVALAAILMLQSVPSVLFYSSNSEFQNHYQLNSTMIIIMCLILFAYKMWQNKGRIKTNRISTITFLLAIFMTLSTVWTGDTTYYNSDFYIIPVLYLAIPYFIDNENDIRFAWMSFSVVSMLFVAKMLQTTLNIGTIYDMEASIDRNYLALFTMIGFMINIATLFQKDKYKNRIYFVLVAVTSVASVFLVLTYASRTAFILMVVFSALLFCYIFFSNPRAVVLVIIMATMAIWWGATTDAALFLIERFSDATMSNANGRTDIASVYLSEFLSENIWFKFMGQGYKVFRATYGSVQLYAHNSYLAMLMDFGLIGGSIYIYTLLYSAIRLWHSEYKIIFISFIVIMAYMFALEVHQDVTGVCYLMTCAGMADVYRKSNKKELSKVVT